MNSHVTGGEYSTNDQRKIKSASGLAQGLQRQKLSEDVIKLNYTQATAALKNNIEPSSERLA